MRLEDGKAAHPRELVTAPRMLLQLAHKVSSTSCVVVVLNVHAVAGRWPFRAQGCSAQCAVSVRRWGRRRQVLAAFTFLALLLRCSAPCAFRGPHERCLCAQLSPGFLLPPYNVARCEVRESNAKTPTSIVVVQEACLLLWLLPSQQLQLAFACLPQTSFRFVAQQDTVGVVKRSCTVLKSADAHLPKRIVAARASMSASVSKGRRSFRGT
jgi:hypothetical protein